MLRSALAAAVLAALVAGQAAGTKPNPPASTQPPAGSPDDRDPGAYPPRSRPAPQQDYAPPAYSPPAPAAGRYIVLTERQKRCGVQRRCELDSRSPCPPCW